MDRVPKLFEKTIVFCLILMMMLVVLLSTIELGYMLVTDVISPPVLMLEIDELLDIFGFFLLILIGVELLETIRAYLQEHVVHVEVVIEVALIAIARKVIILDLKEITSNTLLGIAAIVLALSLAYFLQRRRRPGSRASGPDAGSGGPIHEKTEAVPSGVVIKE
jgi:uncharacterized membrane protein (DUF373 family)